MFTISTKALILRSYISKTNTFLLTHTQLRTNSRKSLSSSPYNNYKPSSSNYQSLFTCTINSPFISHHSYLHRRDFSVHSSAQDEGSSSSSGKPSKSWKTWIVGLLISMFTLPFSFWKNKLNPFLQLKEEVEMIVEEAEMVAELVEKVAEEVVEIADAFDKKLPEGGKLKDAVDFVENVAKEIVKDANIAEDILHKVEEVEKEVDSIIAPVISQVNVGVAKQQSNANANANVTPKAEI